MKIADISIKQPVFITMVIILIVVLGIISYTRLGVDLLPDINLPIVAVTTVNPGVGPEEIESQITKPIEDAISAINGIKKVSSTSAEGVSVVIAEFVLEKDVQASSTEVREKIATIRSTLPREILEPVIDKFDPSAAPILSYTITGKGNKIPLLELRTLIDDKIKTLVQQVDGVGGVTIIGGLEREIHVDVDPNKLNALNLSIAQVSQAIRAENLNLPAGLVTRKDFDFLVRTKAEFIKVEEMKNIIIANPGGSPVYLGDVASVSDEFKTRRAISRVNRRECISLVIRRQSGTNTVKVADSVKELMKKVQREFADLDIAIAINESVFIEESRDDVLKSLIEGAILAGFVVFLSFGDLRNTIITIAGLPVCIIGTFAVIYYYGFTVNVITLMALSLSVGLLIDDAIVVRENIFRHMEKLGKEPKVAAYDGTAEVSLAVMATTFTMVAVFLPVAFATGIAGKFIKQFGISVTAAVLISLFEAFTFAPMLSAYFFKKVEKKPASSFGQKFQQRANGFYEDLGRNYRPMLRWALTHRKTMFAVTTAIFLLSAYLFTLLGTGGNPRGDRPEFNLVIQCQSGSSLESSDRVVTAIENILLGQKEVRSIYSIIGTNDGASDEATINVRLNIPGSQSKAYQDKMRPLLANIPGVTITFQDSFAVSGAAATTMQQLPIQVNFKSSGNNLESLTRAAENAKIAFADIPSFVDVNWNYRTPKPEIQIIIDRDRASRLGVNTYQIASVMRTFIDGDIASRFRAGDRQIDIRVRSSQDVRTDLDRLAKVYIPTLRGGAITLDQVAHFGVVNGPSQIKRSERTRQIIVGGNLLKGTAMSDIRLKVEEKLKTIGLPKDVNYTFGGQIEQQGEQFQSLFISLMLAVVFVYMILASQFGSFIQPFALMLALPLSIIGAVLALLVGNKLFDMVAFIGLIMLMGLVTKNSILLIDFTNVLRRRGINRLEAIIEAGSIRLRPILMTTLAMILGMIPVAFSIGSSTEFRASIGYVIIGGLISSTLLTLLVVPVVYTVLDDIALKFKKKT